MKINQKDFRRKFRLYLILAGDKTWPDIVAFLGALAVSMAAFFATGGIMLGLAGEAAGIPWLMLGIPASAGLFVWLDDVWDEHRYVWAWRELKKVGITEGDLAWLREYTPDYARDKIAEARRRDKLENGESDALMPWADRHG